MKELTFDHVLHLAGDQILPNYMAIKLCAAPRHTLVVTQKTEGQFDLLKKMLKGVALTKAIVDAYDYPSIAQEFGASKDGAGERSIGFNVTGGTKPMSVAAIDFCRESGAVPFYIDTEQRRVFFFHEPFQKLLMPPVFNEVATFIKLSGHCVQACGQDVESSGALSRQALTRLLYTHKALVRRCITEITNSEQKKQDKKDALQAWTEMLETADVALKEAWNAVFPVTHDRREAAEFLEGGWLEEYCLLELSKDKKKLGVVIGLEAGWKGRSDDSSSIAQELDVTFTDGYGLTIVECKTGKIKQEYIQKLENLASTFGGSFGIGILACPNQPVPNIVDRIKAGRNLRCIWGEGLNDISASLSKLATDRKLKIYPDIPEKGTSARLS